MYQETPSSVPYIGCRISLISKSDIRYEGVLSNINPEDATVALEQVQSFGTENRVTDHVIPKGTVVYDYIIFRGSDIKDLQVCDAPSIPTPTPQTYQVDPAPSMTMNQYGNPGPHYSDYPPQVYGFSQPYGYHPIPPQIQRQPVQQGYYPQHQQPPAPPMAAAPFQPGFPASYEDRGSDAVIINSRFDKLEKKPQTSAPKASALASVEVHSTAPARSDSRSTAGRVVSSDEKPLEQTFQPAPRPQAQSRPDQYYRDGASQRGGRGGYSQRPADVHGSRNGQAHSGDTDHVMKEMRKLNVDGPHTNGAGGHSGAHRGGHHGQFANPRRQTFDAPVPREEFNFEAANERFQKDASQPHEPATKPRVKDFFDHFTEDNSSRNLGQDRRNRETFGDMRPAGQRGGHGGYRGGRGGYRGGRGSFNRPSTNDTRVERRPVVNIEPQ